MKITIAVLFGSAILFGCASPAATTDDLMLLPPDKAYEFVSSAPVPVAVAFRNVRDQARKCWSTPYRLVEADPFESTLGFARVSLRLPGDMVLKTAVMTAIDLFPQPDGTTRIVGRSLRSGLGPFPGHADLANLQEWATQGAKSKCM